jgi:opacity protein-like surface antigen
LQFDIGFTKNDVDPVTFDGGKWWSSHEGDSVKHSGYVSQLPIMVSGILDLGSDSVRPYIGAGVGMTRTRIKNVQSWADGSGEGRDSDTDMGFSYQFLAGVKFELSPTSNMHVGYRYLSVDSDYWKGDFENHTISLGLHFRF